jgi:hypothetical protein
MTELCARFGVSRKTGYEWRGRFYADDGCSDGMQDRLRRPDWDWRRTSRSGSHPP